MKQYLQNAAAKIPNLDISLKTSASKRHENGIGIQFVRRIAEKNGGTGTFTYENKIFCAKIMLQI